MCIHFGVTNRKHRRKKNISSVESHLSRCIKKMLKNEGYSVQLENGCSNGGRSTITNYEIYYHRYPDKRLNTINFLFYKNILYANGLF